MPWHQWNWTINFFFTQKKLPTHFLVPFDSTFLDGKIDLSCNLKTLSKHVMLSCNFAFLFSSENTFIMKSFFPVSDWIIFCSLFLLTRSLHIILSNNHPIWGKKKKKIILPTIKDKDFNFDRAIFNRKYKVL